MEVKGTLYYKNQIKIITDSFKKQEFVLEVVENSEYPEFISMELIQDKCGLIDKFDLGTELTVQFNLKGRKWDDPKGGVRFFNTLQAWKVSGDVANQSQSPATADEEDDDLPF